MEQRILDRVCRGQPVKRIGCNGDSVPIERVCEFIASQIRLLGNRNYPIVVILDREKRLESVTELTARALIALQNLGLQDQDIRIFIADREFEDWYLKDLTSICNHFGISIPPNIPSGKGGLSSLISSVANYHETTIGVDLFTIVSLTEICSACGVFSSLMDVAREIQCEALTARLDFPVQA